MHSTDAESPTADLIVEEIVLLLRRIIYAPDASITPQTRLAELGLDSLDLVEAGLELEALLGRDLPASALADARTVGDVARCFGAPATRADLSRAA